jgi:hypothetical protein
MTDRNRKKLIRYIAQIAERAYRRGFQQGHDVCRRGDRQVVDLYRWRYGRSPDKAPSPVGHKPTTAVERLHIQEWELDERLDELLDAN